MSKISSQSKPATRSNKSSAPKTVKPQPKPAQTKPNTPAETKPAREEFKPSAELSEDRKPAKTNDSNKPQDPNKAEDPSKPQDPNEPKKPGESEESKALADKLKELEEQLKELKQPKQEQQAPQNSGGCCGGGKKGGDDDKAGEAQQANKMNPDAPTGPDQELQKLAQQILAAGQQPMNGNANMFGVQPMNGANGNATANGKNPIAINGKGGGNVQQLRAMLSSRCQQLKQTGFQPAPQTRMLVSAALGNDPFATDQQGQMGQMQQPGFAGRLF